MKVEMRDTENNLIAQNLFIREIPNIGNIINHVVEEKSEPIKYIVVNIEYNTRGYKITSVRMVADHSKPADCIIRVKSLGIEKYEDYDFKGKHTIV